MPHATVVISHFNTTRESDRQTDRRTNKRRHSLRVADTSRGKKKALSGVTCCQRQCQAAKPFVAEPRALELRHTALVAMSSNRPPIPSNGMIRSIIQLLYYYTVCPEK